MKATNAAKMGDSGLEDLQVDVAKEDEAGAEHHEEAEEDTTRDRRRPGQPAANPNVEHASHNAGYAAEDEEGECPAHRDLADGAEVCLGAVVRFVDEEDDAHQDAAKDTTEKGAEEGAGEDAGRKRAEALHGFSQETAVAGLSGCGGRFDDYLPGWRGTWTRLRKRTSAGLPCIVATAFCCRAGVTFASWRSLSVSVRVFAGNNGTRNRESGGG